LDFCVFIVLLYNKYGRYFVLKRSQMNRIKKGILTLILTVVLSLSVFALEGEYKNNLLKVDFTKLGDSYYSVNLFTQRPYNSAVKVIKKSDTNYYILLPETYHSITSTPAGNDIKNVEIKLYPYAGQDINNGYTKINITTAKPLNFTMNTKVASGADVPKVDFEKLAKLDSIFAEAPKTTTAVSSTTQTASTVTSPAVPDIQPRTAPSTPMIKPQATSSAAPATVSKSENKQVVNVQMPKPDITQRVEAVKDLVKAASPSTSKTVVIDVENDNERAVATRTTIDIPGEKPVISIDNIPSDDISPLDIDDIDAEGDIMSVDDEAAQEDFLLAGEEVQTLEDDSFLSTVKSALRPAYHFLLDNLGLAVAALVILLLLLLVMLKRTKKPAQSVGISSQSDVMQGEPLEGEIVRGPIPEEEPSIITAEDFIDISPAEFVHSGIEQTKESFEDVVEETVSEQESNQEAEILSCVEIESGRGFYLARFEGKISLLGYVGEDLFVIHTFKEDPQDVRIMHRLSEKSSEGTFYLVKVENTKMLVRSTPDALTLELLM